MTPREILDTSVAQLETLAAFMHEQLDLVIHDPEPLAAETRACDEILGSLNVLIFRVNRYYHCERSDASPGVTP
jgi:hypothetical protein